MKHVLTITIVVLSTAALIGCIVSDTDHRIYLDPDGGLTWVVLERDVRSVDGDNIKRQEQEIQFLNEVRGGSHPVAVGFRELLANSLEYQLLRDARPFSVRTEANFESAAMVVRRLLSQLGVPAQVDMWISDNVTTLEAVIMVDEFQEETVNERVLALVDDPETYQIRLTHGSFIEAKGFVIEEDGALALLITSYDDDRAEGEPLVLSLSWIDG